MIRLSRWGGQFVSCWNLCNNFSRQVSLNWVFNPRVLLPVPPRPNKPRLPQQHHKLARHQSANTVRLVVAQNSHLYDVLLRVVAGALTAQVRTLLILCFLQFSVTACENFPSCHTFQSSPPRPPTAARCSLGISWLANQNSDKPAFTCTPLWLPNYPQVRGVPHYPEAQGLLVSRRPNERAGRRAPAAWARPASRSSWTDIVILMFCSQLVRPHSDNDPSLIIFSWNQICFH